MNNLVPPNLSTKGFSLVPLSKEYISSLHSWESDCSSLYLWSIRKGIFSEQEFSEYLAHRIKNNLHIFLIVLNQQREPIGFVYSYDANLVDGFVFATMYLEPASRGISLGAKVGMVFSDYLFAYFPLRKIYCEVYEYNLKSKSALEHAGFELEGAFKAHRFFRGKFHTLYRYALYRESFYERFDRLLQRIASKTG